MVNALGNLAGKTRRGRVVSCLKRGKKPTKEPSMKTDAKPTKGVGGASVGLKVSRVELHSNRRQN